MKSFSNAIKDIDFDFDNLIIFTNILNAILILLIFSLILTLFRSNLLYAIIPSVLYFIFSTFFKVKKRYYLDIERLYPSMDEKLRTAVDYQNTDNNPIVDELQKEVVDDLKRVYISSFFASRAVSYKIFSSIILSFLIVLLAVNNIYFDFDKLIENLNNNNIAKYNYLTGNESGDEGTNMDVRASGGIASENIYGEPMVAQLGNKKLEMTIKPSSYEVNLGEIEEPERIDFPEVFPDEIFSSSAESYEENIPQEQQDIVKNYFEKITK